MIDLLKSIWDLFFVFVLAPLFIGFILFSAFAFINLVGQKLEKSETFNSLLDDYWWGILFIYWVVGIAVLGIIYLNDI